VTIIGQTKTTEDPMGSSREMSRREVVRLGAGAAALAPLVSVPFLGACGDPERGPPNILFIFSDDHACQAISAYGSRINRTPNIDRIASEGALFENSFCSNSICAPSRAVVLTGKFNHINGKIDNSGDPFDTSQPTFNKALQAAGYQTAMIGKWHLRNDPEGFDYWRVLPGQGHYYNPDFRTPAGTERIEGYVTDIVTDLSLEWLESGRDPEQPFLLMCQHKAPHRSWMPGPDHLLTYEGEIIPEPETLFDDYEGRASPASNQEMSIRDHFYPAYDLKITPPSPDDESDTNLWAATYDRMTPAQQEQWDAAHGPRNAAFQEAGLEGDDLVRYYYQRYIKDYLRCIASVDDNIGRILDYLDESGLAENTLIIYSSDQGFYLGEHGWYDKRWMYEESLRMPFVARWPGRIQAGTRVEHMIQNIDYAPTFLDVAGLPIPEEVQGESLLPLMEGNDPGDWRDSIYYHYYEFPAVHMVARHYGVRTERYKLIHYYETGEWELFDLQTDPQELQSVFDDPGYEAIQAELKAELIRLRTLYRDESGVSPVV
jgi:arylsulfatase A-like enzyme